MDDVRFGGITPYLYYDDLGEAVVWLERVFGFRTISIYNDGRGILSNAELAVGDHELWLDHYPGYKGKKGCPDQWIGIWVDSVERMHARIAAAGEVCGPPVDRPHGVRELQVRDPQGYVWGFLERLP